MDKATLWRAPNFRWLCGGAIISMLGDQFTLIALPWLVLKLSHDPLALGGVAAAMGAPGAIFMLVGGAIVDRMSPRRILLITKCANALLLGLLGVLVLTGQVDLPVVLAFAAAIGLCSAFAFPAGSALLPGVMAPALLPSANAIVMGMRQASMLGGPLLAGLLIAGLGDGGRGGLADGRGLGAAFLLDAASFLLSAATLARVRPLASAASAPAAPKPPLFASLAAGLRYCRDDALLRVCFLYWGAMALFISGPLQVALPLLAARLGGAGSYGSLMASHGAGMLAGMVLAGVRPGLRFATFGTTLLAADGAVGLVFMAMAGAATLWQSAALLLVLGLLGGYLQVAIMSWLQRRIRPDMLGRGMALLMFLFMGMAPLSAALAGALVRVVGLGAIFGGVGLAMLALVAFGFIATPLRHMQEA
jgi:hypothetical protein